MEPPDLFFLKTQAKPYWRTSVLMRQMWQEFCQEWPFGITQASPHWRTPIQVWQRQEFCSEWQFGITQANPHWRTPIQVWTLPQRIFESTYNLGITKCMRRKKVIPSNVSWKTGTQRAEEGDLRCTTRCATLQHMDYHVQRNHTPAGIGSKFGSEEQLATFFKEKGVSYDRDWGNFIKLSDFYLHAKSAELGCVFLVKPRAKKMKRATERPLFPSPTSC